MVSMQANRRDEGRVPVHTFYNEYVNDRPYRGMITNVSSRGLRVERLLRPSARMSRVVQLEFELPGTGEVIWAKGEACFDELEIAEFGPAGQGPAATLHASGIMIVALANKHARMIHEYVHELKLARQRSVMEEAAAMLRARRIRLQ
jgi:hypothetical protein